MAMPDAVVPTGGIVLERGANSSGLVVDRHGNYRVDDGGSWRHGATESQRRMRLDGRAQGGGDVRCRGNFDG